MPRWVSFALFFALLLAVTGLIHRYLWARLVRDAALPEGWHRALTWLLVALWLSVPAGFFVSRPFSGTGIRWRLVGVLAWLGVMFLLLTVSLVTEPLRLAARWSGEVADPERRLTFARLLAGGTALLAGGASVAALREGLSRVKVQRVEVPLARLPPELDGFTIVQLTDVHVGPTLHRGFVEEVVKTVNSLEPDLVAITGDLVDGSVAALRRHVAPLADLRSRHGTYFVTGNHEYYSGVDSWLEELARLGMRVLRNERVSIGEGAASFDLAGIDDASAHRFGGGHGADLARALKGRDPARELVLLAHQPKALRDAVPAGVGLQLSGHTHGGQIWPWSYLVKLDQPVVSGLARIAETLVYVSNGTGYWGPPMRLGAPAEVTEIVLRSRPGAERAAGIAS